MKRKILTALLAISCVFPLSALSAEEAKAMMPPAPWIRPYILNGRNEMEAELVSGLYGNKDFAKSYPKGTYTLIRVAPASGGDIIVRMSFRRGPGKPFGDTSFLAHRTGRYTYEGNGDGFTTSIEFRKNTISFTRRQSNGRYSIRGNQSETAFRLSPEDFTYVPLPRRYVPMAKNGPSEMMAAEADSAQK